MKTTNKKQTTTTKQENTYNPSLNNIHKGKALSFLIENVEVLKNNMNNPYKLAANTFPGQTEESFSSSVAILLNEKLKKEILENLAFHFKNEKGLSMALDHFVEKKISTLEDGKEVIYASVKWVKNGSGLSLSKPLPVEGVEGKFPFQFSGKIAIGISYSLQHTFAIYLNGVIVENVIKQESEFSGFTASGTYNPTLAAPISQSVEEEIREYMEEEKQEEKKSKLKFW